MQQLQRADLPLVLQSCWTIFEDLWLRRVRSLRRHGRKERSQSQRSFAAACSSPRNGGLGRPGRDLNSGWNCTPT